MSVKSKQFDNRYLLRIASREEIVKTLARFCLEEHIAAATVDGIGTADKLTLCYYDFNKKNCVCGEFCDVSEILSLKGNIALVESKPWPHLRVVLADKDLNAFGRHLRSAHVGATCETFLEKLDTIVHRAFDEETGLKLLDL